MTVDELKKKIGKEKFEEIDALVRKAKVAGKSTDEIVAMLRAKFSDEFVLENQNIEPLIQIYIPPPPPPPPPGKP